MKKNIYLDVSSDNEESNTDHFNNLNDTLSTVYNNNLSINDVKYLTSSSLMDNKNYDDHNKDCILNINKIMPDAINKYTIDFMISEKSENIKKETKQMIGFIKESMVKRIPKMEWLDEKTKENAINKVLKMKEDIGNTDGVLQDLKILYQKYKYVEVKDVLSLELSKKMTSERIILENFIQNGFLENIVNFLTIYKNTLTR